MTTHHFDLTLDRDSLTEADADVLFDLFGGDVAAANMAGTPTLMCGVEAESFAAAVATTVAVLRERGFAIDRVVAEPDAVAA